jgi:hypothetical protein
LMTCRDTEVESIRYSEKRELSSKAARCVVAGNDINFPQS